MSDEVWRPVHIGDLKEKYEVSNLGHVRRSAKLLTPYAAMWDGRKKRKKVRLVVAMTDDGGKVYRASVTRLVAKVFCENQREEADQVNHKDGNPSNNVSSNLEWVTREENMQHARDTGLFIRGKDHPKSKIDHARLRVLVAAGARPTDIAKEFGCTKEAVCSHTARYGLRLIKPSREVQRETLTSRLKEAPPPKNPTHKKIVSLYVQGKRKSDIGAIVGLKNHTISHILRKAANPHKD